MQTHLLILVDQMVWELFLNWIAEFQRCLSRPHEPGTTLQKTLKIKKFQLFSVGAKIKKLKTNKQTIEKVVIYSF